MLWFKKKPTYVPRPPRAEPFRKHYWKPRVYLLKKDLPGIQAGARFQQSYHSDNVYFHGIPISSEQPEKNQVGIIEFEAQYVESNSEWFTPQNSEIVESQNLRTTHVVVQFRSKIRL